MIAGCRNCAHTISLEVGDRVPHSCPSCGINWQTITTAPVGSDWFALVPFPASVLPPVESSEISQLARWLDAHPGTHARLMRHNGKWVIRVASSIGFGATVADAAVSVGHALAVDDSADREARSRLDTVPEAPRCRSCGKGPREGNHATDLGVGHDYDPERS